MSYIVGGTGEFGAVTIEPRSPQDHTIIKCETFADAKAATAELANAYISHLANNHGLRAHYVEGQHPSQGSPAVTVRNTDLFPANEYINSSPYDCHPVFMVEIRVNVEYEDGSRNNLLDRTFKAGKLVLS